MITSYDRIKETATTTGTGAFTLDGAVSQFVAFQTKFATGSYVYYAIVGQTGTEWEVGLGVLSAATTLQRTYPLRSSNSDAVVNFSAGTKDVFNTIPSDWVSEVPTLGEAQAANNGGGALIG